MRTILTATAVAVLAATPALAKVTIQDLDVSGDNFVSFEEARNAIPEMDRNDFRAIDANNDRRLSVEEINALDAQERLAQHQMRSIKERPLALVDQDGDGFMSFDDIARVHPNLTQSAFDTIDSNGDNRVTYSEYYSMDAQTALAQCEAGTFMDLASMDQNGDNFLSMEELKGGYPNASPADFRTIDLNKDNRISSVELLSPTAECLNR